MSSPAEEKIAGYERRIEEHRAEIKQIKDGTGIYSDTSNKEKRDLIKSVKDGIHDCETAIHDLRQQQQGEFFIMMLALA